MGVPEDGPNHSLRGVGFVPGQALRLVPKDSPMLHEVMPRYEGDPRELAPLSGALFSVMTQAKPHAGIGIAAPQCGVRVRMFVVNDAYAKWRKHRDSYVCINPEVLWAKEPEVEQHEACLSHVSEAGYFINVLVKRKENIGVRYTDDRGKVHERELFGMLARAYQHELDHLDGKVIWAR